MPTTIRMADPVPQHTTAAYTFEVVDENEEGVPAAQLNAMVLTYYDLATGTAINSRSAQNVLNANDVTIASVTGPPLVTTVTWIMQPEDAILLNTALAYEPHIALFEWSWGGNTRRALHEVQILVEAITHVAALT